MAITQKRRDNRSGTELRTPENSDFSENFKRLFGKYAFHFFFLVAVILNYLPDITPYYIAALSHGNVHVAGGLNRFKESCDSDFEKDLACRVRYRIPHSFFEGQESIGLGVILFPVSIRCAERPKDILFLETLSDFNIGVASRYLKTYQTFDLNRLNCRSDLIVENWSLSSRNRFGHAQAPIVLGTSEWVTRVKNLVEFSISGLLALAFSLFVLIQVLLWTLGRLTSTELRYPPFDRFKFYWLTFIFLNTGYLFEDVIPINIPGALVQRCSNFLGLAIVAGPTLLYIAQSKKINSLFRKIAQLFVGKNGEKSHRLILLLLAANAHPYFGYTYAPVILIFSITAIAASIWTRNSMMLFYGLAATSDALKIMMLPGLPASRLTVTYLLFVLIYQMIPRILALETSARFDAGTDLALEVAHDIRSPIGALNSVLPLMTGSQELKEIAKEALSRIREIADDLLKRSKTDFSQHQSSTPLDLVELIKNQVLEKRSEFSGRNVILEPIIAEEKFISYGDRVALKRVISNLVNNAEASFKDGGLIKIHLSKNEGLNPRKIPEPKLLFLSTGYKLKDLLSRYTGRGIRFKSANYFIYFHLRSTTLNVTSWNPFR